MKKTKSNVFIGYSEDTANRIASKFGIKIFSEQKKLFGLEKLKKL